MDTGQDINTASFVIDIECAATRYIQSKNGSHENASHEQFLNILLDAYDRNMNIKDEMPTRDDPLINQISNNIHDSNDKEEDMVIDCGTENNDDDDDDAGTVRNDEDEDEDWTPEMFRMKSIDKLKVIVKKNVHQPIEQEPSLSVIVCNDGDLSLTSQELEPDKRDKSCSCCCEKVFKYQEDLLQHKANDECSSPYTCHCGKVFISKSGIRKHGRSVHGKQPGEKLDYCGRFDEKKNSFSAVTNKSNVCCCQKVFKCQEDLLQHKANDECTSPYTCQFCGKVFISKSGFRKHARSVHGKRLGEQIYYCGRFDEKKNSFSGSVIEPDTVCESTEETANSQVQVTDTNVCCCEKVFRFREDLLQHKANDECSSPYTCHCGKIFISKGGIRKHARSVHGTKLGEKLNYFSRLDEKKNSFAGDNVSYNLCGDTELTEDTLMTTNKVSATDMYKGYVMCIRCDEKCASEADLVQHDCSSPYTCHCGKVFIARRRFRKHSFIYHGEQLDLIQEGENVDNRFICKCGEKFHTIQHLKIHDENCTSTKSVCHICGDRLKADTLRKHIRRHELPFHCICERRFKTKDRLQDHAAVCDKNKRNICSTCGADVHMKSKLREHYNTEHRRENFFHCLRCDYSNPRWYKLQQHNRLQHATTKDLKHLCNICGKAFPVKFKLACHTRYAHSGKKIICNICNKNFCSQASLKRHMKNVHHVSM